MTASRKRRRSRSAPPLPEPSDKQMLEAMCAFERLKVRYKLMQFGEREFVVRVEPEWMAEATITDAYPPTVPSGDLDCAFRLHRFVNEKAARQWREREIIRETVKVAMRTRP